MISTEHFALNMLHIIENYTLIKQLCQTVRSFLSWYGLNVCEEGRIGWQCFRCLVSSSLIIFTINCKQILVNIKHYLENNKQCDCIVLQNPKQLCKYIFCWFVKICIYFLHNRSVSYVHVCQTRDQNLPKHHTCWCHLRGEYKCEILIIKIIIFHKN